MTACGPGLATLIAGARTIDQCGKALVAAAKAARLSLSFPCGKPFWKLYFQCQDGLSSLQHLTSMESRQWVICVDRESADTKISLGEGSQPV